MEGRRTQAVHKETNEDKNEKKKKLPDKRGKSIAGVRHARARVTGFGTLTSSEHARTRFQSLVRW